MSFKSCRVMAMCAAVWIAGCGGLSDVGKQKNDDAAPVADALVLNQPFTKDGSGKVSARVRSGAEVFLSGNDSEGTVAPVLKLDWVLLTTGPVASQVQLVDRNSSTVSFRAPQVAVDTLLQFRLTVTDSNGATDQADVDVGARGLGRGFLEVGLRLSHGAQFPQSLFSNSVERRPRSTMSQR